MVSFRCRLEYLARGNQVETGESKIMAGSVASGETIYTSGERTCHEERKQFDTRFFFSIPFSELSRLSKVQTAIRFEKRSGQGQRLPTYLFLAFSETALHKSVARAMQ